MQRSFVDHLKNRTFRPTICAKTALPFRSSRDFISHCLCSFPCSESRRHIPSKDKGTSEMRNSLEVSKSIGIVIFDIGIKLLVAWTVWVVGEVLASPDPLTPFTSEPLKLTNCLQIF